MFSIDTLCNLLLLPLLLLLLLGYAHGMRILWPSFSRRETQHRCSAGLRRRVKFRQWMIKGYTFALLLFLLLISPPAAVNGGDYGDRPAAASADQNGMFRSSE
jgi:hypothetical protein